MGRRSNVLYLSVFTLAAIGSVSAISDKDKKSSGNIVPPAPVVDSADDLAKILKTMADNAAGRIKARSSSNAEMHDGDTMYPHHEIVARATAAAGCLDSTATDVTINSIFFHGGPGATVALCPGATVKITNPIFMTDSGQSIITQGLPKDNTRATIVITGPNQSMAIFAACDKCQNVAVRNVQIDGNRPILGPIDGGAALIEMGGNTKGQTVDNCHVFEPRGWSCLHGIEGYNNLCEGMIVTNNQIGPSGHAPNMGSQFRKRDSMNGQYAGGQWADGISMACQKSLVQNNVVTDATDGAIVAFGSPGTHIMGNTIIADTRQLMGGLNAVDYGPFGGSYAGLVITGNTVIAKNNLIKVGMGIGGMVWGSNNSTGGYTTAGTFNGNTFKSVNGGFGYAVAVAGHTGATVQNNDASGAKYAGVPSQACIPNPMVPKSQAFVFDPYTTGKSSLQTNFVEASLVFLICQQADPHLGYVASKRSLEDTKVKAERRTKIRPPPLNPEHPFDHMEL